MKKIHSKSSKNCKKSKALSRHDKIINILAKVSEIVDYAIDNQITQPAQMEELECMLNDWVK